MATLQTVNTQAIFANAYKEKLKLEKNMRIQRNNTNSAEKVRILQ